LSEDDVVRAGGREAVTTRGLAAGSSNLLAPDPVHVKRAPNPRGG